MERDVPVFGFRNDTLPQQVRACAYVVVANGHGRIAGVRESKRLFLPGGGIEFPENPSQAIHRELREELGCRVILGGRIGQALKYFHNDGYCQALYATFYSAEFGEKIAESQEHELEWALPEDFFHEHHAWAARKHLNSQRRAASHG
jgi:8-oxo-dGTP diphosphatase